jgi:protein SCO1/2
MNRNGSARQAALTMRRLVSVVGWITVTLILWLPSAALGQMTGAPSPGYRRDAGTPASAMPAALREIGFDQNLNQELPLDVVLRDERGRPVRLGKFFNTKPVVLAFVYYECPMLCTQILSSMTSTFSVLALEPGDDFEIITVSFDPRETPDVASSMKAQFIERYDRAGAERGWHFLTGDQPAIDRLTEAAGFRYAWDQDSQQFAHPSGIIVLTPDGVIARYLFGLEYGPRDLRLALVEASEGRVGSAIDSLMLFCYHYDPTTGRYGLVVMRVLRIAGLSTVLALASFIIIMIRRERRQAC